MRDFAEWCRCKASETDGEGSVLKYMTEPESRRQRSRCVAMQTSFFMSARVGWGGFASSPPAVSLISKNDQTRKREDNEGRKQNIFAVDKSSDRQTHSEIFEKELPCEAMRDFAAWCRCKASETDGEGSVLKYMTEPESRRQRSRCVAMQTSYSLRRTSASFLLPWPQRGRTLFTVTRG